MYYTNHCCLYPSYKCGNMTGKQVPHVRPSRWCNSLMVGPSSRSPIHPSTTPTLTLTHTQSEEEGRFRQTQAAAIFGGSISVTASTPYRCPSTLTYISPADATTKATHTHTHSIDCLPPQHGPWDDFRETVWKKMFIFGRRNRLDNGTDDEQWEHVAQVCEMDAAAAAAAGRKGVAVRGHVWMEQQRRLPTHLLYCRQF